MDTEQVRKLLDKLVSMRTRRAFKAFLAWDAKEGKVVFEFEPRASKFPPRKTAGAGAAAPAAQTATAQTATAKATTAAKAPAAKKVVRKTAAAKK